MRKYKEFCIISDGSMAMRLFGFLLHILYVLVLCGVAYINYNSLGNSTLILLTVITMLFMLMFGYTCSKNRTFTSKALAIEFIERFFDK